MRTLYYVDPNAATSDGELPPLACGTDGRAERWIARSSAAAVVETRSAEVPAERVQDYLERWVDLVSAALVLRHPTSMTKLGASDIKPFVGSKDFDESRDFYVALGWKLNFDAGDLAELELGDCRFYLQKYYQQQWCDNSMLHITVDDAEAWFRHVSSVLDARPYGAARVKPPKKESYGALVTYVWDPSGVLLHFAQPSG